MTAPQIHYMLLGDSAAMRKVRALIERVAPTELSVLISGPTGSGKELVARALHAGSERRGQFVAFNVCAIPETLFEDALFGHVRGAFTGAVNSSAGFLREAHGGTAFFDEIGGLSTNAQAKLLRAVETHEFRPVGASADARSDFRLVAAANEDIWDLERAGRFRADLAHRCSAFVIRVPSLRERIEDIPLLALTFLREVGDAYDVSIGGDAIRLLKGHDWPGNVRELKQVVLSAATLGGTQQLRSDDVREVLTWMAPQRPFTSNWTMADHRLLEVLKECSWNMHEAARQLCVHRTTIYRRLKRVGITKRSQGAGEEMNPSPRPALMSL